MKFKYQKRPAEISESHPNRTTILRPIIPVTLWNGEKFIDTDALIDSGADDCIFSAEIGDAIGLNIKNGKLARYTGVGGESINAYFHEVCLEIGGHKFSSYIGFSYDTQLKIGLLGQNEFFNLFGVLFDLQKETIELRQKSAL